MGGTLWDGADLLAALGGVDAAGTSADVPAGTAGQLVGPASADDDVVVGAAHQGVGASTAIEQVREGAPDQLVVSWATGQRARLTVDRSTDHHAEPRIGVKGVAATAEVADDRADVPGRAAHLRRARLTALRIVEA